MKIRLNLKTVIIFFLCLIVLGIGIGTYFFDQFYFQYRRKFPYSQKSQLVWKLDEPGSSVMPVNFLLDEKRKLVITAFDLDENSNIKNKLFLDNCKQEHYWSCIFFINSETGKLVKSLIIEGNIMKQIDDKNDTYLSVNNSKAKNGNGGAKLIKVNKDSYQVTTIFENTNESSYFIEQLKIIDKYLIFADTIYNDGKSKESLNILDTSTGKLYKYPRPITLSNIVVLYAENNRLKIYELESRLEVLYDILQNKIVNISPLSDLDFYRYSYNSIASADNSVVYYTESTSVKAMDVKMGLLWSVDLRPKSDTKKIVRIDDQPYVDDKNVYVATQYREFYSLDKQTGKINWKVELPVSVGNDFVVYKNKAYYGSFGNFLDPTGFGIIDLEKGKLVHLEQPKDAGTYWLWSRPILSPPYVYLQNDFSGVYKFKLLD